jgi:CcmD family protein
METFIAAYTLVGVALAGYVLFLRLQQQSLERRTKAIETRVFDEAWPDDEPFSVRGR